MRHATRHLVPLLATCTIQLFLAPSAKAEPDALFLGEGRRGPLVVNAAGLTINPHTPVVGAVAAGSWSIDVARTAGFLPGDVVLVLQVTGLADRPSGDQTPVVLDATNVGRYEFVRIATIATGRFTFATPLQGPFDANVTQAVLVPEYTTVSIGAAGSLVAPSWDGSSGGVLAFFATGAVTNDGILSAASAGFRGGVRHVDWYIPPVNCPGLDEASPRAERKGEGLIPGRFTPTSTGRGNAANGAGGGNCINAGGGGGGHAGVGGLGGDSWPGEGRLVRGGLGGAPVSYSLLDRAVFGGGGGAGQQNNSLATDGARGGGLIFLRAQSLAGAGRIVATGGRAVDATSDGGGGGGAGGAILLRFVGDAACNTVDASGGGGANSGGSHGPGGGGAGGRVFLQAGGNVACPVRILAGAPGLAGGVAWGAGPTSVNDPASTGEWQQSNAAFRVPAVPVITTPVDGTATRDATPRLAGTAEANVVLALSLNGVIVVRIAANGGGNWSWTPPADLADGTYELTIRAELLGAASVPTDPVRFTVDTRAPQTTLSAPPASPASSANAIFTITADEPATFECAFDGPTYSPCTSPLSYTGLADGPHVLLARARDAANNVDATPARAEWTVLATPPPSAPVLLSPVDGAVLSDPRPALQGTAGAGLRVVVTLDGVALSPVNADASGAWRIPGGVAVADGVHTFSAVAIDAFDRTSPPSATHRFTVDTRAPDAPLFVSPAQDAVLSTRRPTITGTAEAGTMVRITLDGGVPVEVRATNTGEFSWIVTSDLAEGAHVVGAVSVDAAGNVGASAVQRRFVVDVTAPVATVRCPPALVASPVQAVTFTSSEAGNFSCSLDAAPFSACTSPRAIDLVTDGPHRFELRATDVAGNVSAVVACDVTLDATAPVAPVITVPADGAVLAVSPAAIAGTSESGTTVALELDGLPLAPATTDAAGRFLANVPQQLRDGSHLVTGQATDPAGNTGPRADAVRFTVDTQAPDTTLLVPVPALVATSSLRIEFAASESGCTFTCAIDRGPFEPCVSPWTRNYGDGARVVTVVATDAAGNADPTPLAVRFTVDTQSPSAPVLSTATRLFGLSPVTLEGTAEAGARVVLSIEGVLAPVEVFADESGRWSATFTRADGPFVVTARAIDAAGNTSAEAGFGTFELDTVVPEAPLVTWPLQGAELLVGPLRVEGTAPGCVLVFATMDVDTEDSLVLDGVEAFAFDRWETTLLAPGLHRLEVECSDRVGHPSAKRAVTFTVVEPEQPDAGAPDAGEVDAGEVDAGEVDAGEVDAGEVDAGTPDAGEVDAGALEPDAGEVVADAGEVVADAGAVEPSEFQLIGGGCGCGPTNAGAMLWSLFLLAFRRRRSAT